MPQTRDWQGMKDMSARLLEERTGEDLGIWIERIAQAHLDDEPSLRAWLCQATTKTVASRRAAKE